MEPEARQLFSKYFELITDGLLFQFYSLSLSFSEGQSQVAQFLTINNISNFTERLWFKRFIFSLNYITEMHTTKTFIHMFKVCSAPGAFNLDELSEKD